MLPVMMMPSRRAAWLQAVVLAAGALLSTDGNAGEKSLPPPVVLPAVAKEVTAVEAAPLVAARSVSILDIRTATEVKEQGRIPGSKHLDYLREDFSTALREQVKIDPMSPCLVYCALGGRAQHAAQRLADLGFKKILVLKDGFNAWKKAGLPLETVN